MPPSQTVRVIKCETLRPPALLTPDNLTLSRRNVILPTPIDFHLGDILRLRKPHPCGGYEWRVDRLGADIGIRCLTCGRRVLIPRQKLAKRIKSITRAGDEPLSRS
jgi:hypothetical protein